jgi:hypothetical protein
MKREIKIEIKDDLNHYALIKQKNNRENQTDYGMFIDKDQYEQLRQHFVSGSLLADERSKGYEEGWSACLAAHGLDE